MGVVHKTDPSCAPAGIVSSLRHVFPLRSTLPCHACFVAACELGVAFFLSVAHAMVA